MSHIRYYLVIIGAASLMFAIALGTTCLSFFVEPITEEFGFSRSAFTVYSSLIPLVGMITIPFIGRIISKVGVQIVVVVGGIYTAICVAGFSFCNSLVSFYIVGALVGLTLFGITNVAATIVINTWFIKKRGTFMGIVMASSGISGAIFGLFFPTLIADFGWRFGYIILAVGILVFTVPSGLLLLRNSPASVALNPYGAQETLQGVPESGTGSAAITESVGVSYKTATKSLPFYVCLVLILISSIVSGALQHLPSIFTSSGLSPVEAGSLMSIMMVVLIVAKILIGFLNDKFGAKVTTIIVYSIFICSLVVLVTSHSFILFVIAMVCFAFGLGSPTVMLPLITGKIFGQKDFAAIWSILSIFSALGNAISAPVWGLSYDLTGSYAVAAAGSALLSVLIIVLTFVALNAGSKLEQSDSYLSSNKN
ncbi:MFS transporter [Actinomycetota bacterium]|nr:MFS transporter [Actinomycetota bacterium]